MSATPITAICVSIEMLLDDLIQVGEDDWEPNGTQSWQQSACWGTDEAGAIERAQSLTHDKVRVVRTTTTREILWEPR